MIQQVAAQYMLTKNFFHIRKCLKLPISPSVLNLPAALWLILWSPVTI